MSLTPGDVILVTGASGAIGQIISINGGLNA
jgi:NADPH-dependent curcumin reductase CurA